MSDARLRALERAWRTSGAPADEAAWLRERVRQGDDTLARLYFPGNPWPAGHRLKASTWGGWLDARGIRFSIDLEGERFSDAGAPRLPAPGEDPDGGPGGWGHPFEWKESGPCSLITNKGFLAGTEAEPLDLDRLAEREWRVDPLSPGQTAAELSQDALGFHPGFLGFEEQATVADHRLRFMLREGASSWWLRWSGRVALTHAGRFEFEREFELPFALVRFEGLKVLIGLGGEAEAWALLARFVVSPAGWRFCEHHGCTARFRPIGTTTEDGG